MGASRLDPGVMIPSPFASHPPCPSSLVVAFTALPPTLTSLPPPRAARARLPLPAQAPGRGPGAHLRAARRGRLLLQAQHRQGAVRCGAPPARSLTHPCSLLPSPFPAPSFSFTNPPLSLLSLSRLYLSLAAPCLPACLGLPPTEPPARGVPRRVLARRRAPPQLAPRPQRRRRRRRRRHCCCCCRGRSACRGGHDKRGTQGLRDHARHVCRRGFDPGARAGAPRWWCRHHHRRARGGVAYPYHGRRGGDGRGERGTGPPGRRRADSRGRGSGGRPCCWACRSRSWPWPAPHLAPRRRIKTSGSGSGSGGSACGRGVDGVGLEPVQLGLPLRLVSLPRGTYLLDLRVEPPAGASRVAQAAAGGGGGGGAHGADRATVVVAAVEGRRHGQRRLRTTATATTATRLGGGFRGVRRPHSRLGHRRLFQ